MQHLSSYVEPLGQIDWRNPITWKNIQACFYCLHPSYPLLQRSAKRRGCFLSHSQAEPGRELTQPSQPPPFSRALYISLPQIESPCSYEDDEFGRRRGTHCSFLMRTASSPTPTNLAAEAENEDKGEAGNSNSELRRPTQGRNHTPCSSVFSANVF